MTNDDSPESSTDEEKFGGIDIEVAQNLKGQDFGSILTLLNETNSGGKDDPSGSSEYKAAYRAVEDANRSLTLLRDSINNDHFGHQEEKQSMEKLYDCKLSISRYLSVNSKGIFFKHPITPKGKKRYACMENALNIIDASLDHYRGIKTTNDAAAINVEAVTSVQRPGQIYTQSQLAELSRATGFDGRGVTESIYNVAQHMSETFFDIENLTSFLSDYKMVGNEVAIKALLMQAYTPAANKAIVNAFKLGGPNLAEQLETTYELLKAIDKMADELWKKVAPNEDSDSEPNAELLLEYKKQILKLIRKLNIDREIQAREYNRF